MTIYITSDTRVAEDEILTDTDPVFDEALDVPSIVAYEDQSDGSTVFANAGLIQGILEQGLEIVGLAISRASGTGSGYFHNESTGVIEISSNTVIDPRFAYQWMARGIFAPQQAIDILNEGRIEIHSATSSAVGIETWGIFNNTIDNRGVIVVDAGADGYGVRMINSDQLLNSGRIEVYAVDIAVGIDIGHYGGEGVDNSGTIIVRASTQSPWATVGLSFFSLGDSVSQHANIVRNSGTIDADIAIYANDGNGYASTLSSRELLLNSGLLKGDVILAYGDDTILNTGTINGFVDLGEGRDFFDGRRGRQGEGVFGGSGNDVLIGGARADLLIGDAGADQISGGAGDDFIYGGRGGDGLDGGDGFDLLSYADGTQGIVADLVTGVVLADARDLIRGFEGIVGSPFDDTIAGSAVAELLDGGYGYDELGGGAGEDTLIGGAGNDTLRGGAGADLFEYSVDDGVDTIIDFTPGVDQLEVLGYSAALQVIQVGSDTRIELSDTDHIILVGVLPEELSGGDLLFDPDHVLVRSEPLPAITLAVNADLLIGYDEWLLLFDPIPVLLSDQYFENTGIVMQRFGSTPGVYNAGIVDVRATLSDATTVGIRSSIADGPAFGEALVVNAGSGEIYVAALGGGDVIGIEAYDGFWNAGILDVYSDAADALGVGFGSYDSRFVNSGTLFVTAAGVATGISAIQPVFNSGTIDVYGSGGAIAVELEGGRTNDVIVNSGTIIATDDTTAADSVALHLSSFVYDYTLGRYTALDVWNSGSVSGDYAIRAFTRISPEPITGFNVYNSGSLDGIVELGVGVDLVLNRGSITGNVRLLGGNDRFDGRGGTLNGVLNGGDGNDALFGGTGIDTILGGAGNDTIAGGAGADRLSGGIGNDLFHVEQGFGNDLITDFSAGGTVDRVRVAGYSGHESIEQVGPDTLVRFSATDTLLLKNVTAGALTAADFIFDARALAAPPELPVAPLASEAPLTPGSPAVEAIALIGGAFSDTLSGSAANDIGWGLEGADAMHGAGGNDSLQGGAGNDRLFGDTGADTLIGGAGRDVSRGAGGADYFVFAEGDFAGTTLSSCDAILDFTPAQGDRIDLGALDAVRTQAGNDDFTFIGTAAFGALAGELRFQQFGASTVIMGDTNGDAVADFWIRLAGTHMLAASDFVL